MVIIVPALIMIVGLLMLLISKDPVIRDLGRIMFGVGLLVTLLDSKEVAVNLLSTH